MDAKLLQYMFWNEKYVHEGKKKKLYQIDPK